MPAVDEAETQVTWNHFFFGGCVRGPANSLFQFLTFVGAAFSRQRSGISKPKHCAAGDGPLRRYEEDARKRAKQANAPRGHPAPPLKAEAARGGAGGFACVKLNADG